VSQLRAEAEWPLARTQYTPLFLDAGSASLGQATPANATEARYDALTGCAHFDYKFERAAEITGYASLHLWVEADGANDMDLFVALQKLDREGQPVGFVFYAFYENGPIALGWLRASHRELDAARSTPWQPVHPHTRELPLEPGVPVAVDIEIWPSSTRFAPGETLRVLVQGRDIYTDALPNLPFARHEELRNRGTHVLHTGGSFDSHLLVPFIP
jgi:predicted acyl esterase